MRYHWKPSIRKADIDTNKGRCKHYEGDKESYVQIQSPQKLAFGCDLPVPIEFVKYIICLFEKSGNICQVFDEQNISSLATLSSLTTHANIGDATVPRLVPDSGDTCAIFT